MEIAEVTRIPGPSHKVPGQHPSKHTWRELVVLTVPGGPSQSLHDSVESQKEGDTWGIKGLLKAA